ncbi:helix-turn-helix domain-containing protein [Undibacterium sp.]|uniref:helix-turn-helix domain-containing protein n=1 Tax=Undibacterium sp. TaxID=1914977 RepID=UPI00374D718D
MSEVGPNLLPEQLNTSEPELEPVAEDAAAVDAAAAAEVIAINAAAPAAIVADHSAGGQLAAARKQKNMSVQQVADQLKLSPRQVAAMEANQFDALPKAVIVRGFVRSYAKLLKIEAEPIIALLPQDATPAGAQVSALKPAMATPFMESRLPLLNRPDANNNKYIWGAGLLAVAAAAFFAFQKFEHSGFLKDLFPAASSPVAASAASEPAENTAMQSATPSGDEQPGSGQSMQPLPAIQDAGGKVADADNAAAKPEAEKKAAEPVSTIAAVPAPVAATASPGPAVAAPATVAGALARPATAPAATAASAPAAVAVVASPAAADPANAMKLKFRQDSWVQVKRANGTVVTSHLAKAGTEESFDVKEPLQVRLGNASGVDGQLRGAAMEIQGGKDSNVVNLNVK